MIDSSVFERRRNGINQNYARRAAQNNHSRTMARSRGTRGISDARRNFGRSMPGFRAGLGRRGITGPGVSSGVANRALSRRAVDFQRGIGRMQQDHAQDMRQFDLAEATMRSERERELARLEMDKQREIALAAMNLKAIAPYIGG